MGFFTSNWPEIASALVAAAALVVALRVGWENRRFKSPDFRLSPQGQTKNKSVILELTNRGESVAKNVAINFAIDPTAILTSSPLNWEAIDKGESVEIILEPPASLSNGAVADWLASVIYREPGRRVAVVEYTTKLGKRQSEEVLIPNARELESAAGHYWRGELDSQ